MGIGLRVLVYETVGDLSVAHTSIRITKGLSRELYAALNSLSTAAIAGRFAHDYGDGKVVDKPTDGYGEPLLVVQSRDLYHTLKLHLDSLSDDEVFVMSIDSVLSCLSHLYQPVALYYD